MILAAFLVSRQSKIFIITKLIGVQLQSQGLNGVYKSSETNMTTALLLLGLVFMIHGVNDPANLYGAASPSQLLQIPINIASSAELGILANCDETHPSEQHNRLK